MKIIQITACALPDSYKDPAIIFGLGDDNLVYYWDEQTGKWKINMFKQSK